MCARHRCGASRYAAYRASALAAATDDAEADAAARATEAAAASARAAEAEAELAGSAQALQRERDASAELRDTLDHARAELLLAQEASEALRARNEALSQQITECGSQLVGRSC